MEYVEQSIERKYETDFQFLFEEVSDAGETKYCFSHSSTPGKIIRAVYRESNDPGQIYTIVPFEHRVWVEDDFQNIIKEYCVENYLETNLDLSVLSIAEATDAIYNLMAKINEMLQGFGVDVTIYSCDVSLVVYSMGSPHNIRFYAMNKDTIQDCLLAEVS